MDLPVAESLQQVAPVLGDDRESIAHQKHRLLVFITLNLRCCQIDQSSFNGVLVVSKDKHVRPSHNLRIKNTVRIIIVCIGITTSVPQTNTVLAWIANIYFLRRSKKALRKQLFCNGYFFQKLKMFSESYLKYPFKMFEWSFFDRVRLINDFWINVIFF